MRTRFLTVVVLAVLVAGIAAPALAQGGPAPAPAPEETPREDVTRPLIAIGAMVVLFVVIGVVVWFSPRPR